MDFGAVLRMMLALIATLGILGLLAYAAKRFDIMSLFNGDQKLQRPKKLADFFAPRPGQVQKRLQIVEQRILDARTRLMVVRWDDMEHLILVGGSDGGVIASKAAPPAPIQQSATISGSAA